MRFAISLVCIAIGIHICSVEIHAQQRASKEVVVQGAMRNVMQKGQLQGTIYLDTITHKEHLYALGPKAYLTGEILVLDARSFVSSVQSDGSIKVTETYQVEAPFLVYTNNPDWENVALPDSIQTIKDLETYLDAISKNRKRPFVFKLEGTMSQVDFHIQNLPAGTVVRSPKDAHTGQGKFSSQDVESIIIGFFSTEHQRIFTHHDAYVHLHYIDAQFTEMGHVDALQIGNAGNLKLFIAAE